MFKTIEDLAQTNPGLETKRWGVDALMALILHNFKLNSLSLRDHGQPQKKKS